MVKNQARGDKTKLRITRKAYPIFGKKGYANTGLVDIAKAAKVTTGAIYYHFGDKRGLFEAVCLESGQIILKMLVEKVGQVRFDIDYLEEVVLAAIEVCSDTRIQQIITRDAPTLYTREEWRNIEEYAAYGVLKAGIVSLEKEGKIATPNPEILSKILLSIILEAAAEVCSAKDKGKALNDTKLIVREMVRTFIPPNIH